MDIAKNGNQVIILTMRQKFIDDFLSGVLCSFEEYNNKYAPELIHQSLVFHYETDLFMYISK